MRSRQIPTTSSSARLSAPLGTRLSVTLPSCHWLACHWLASASRHDGGLWLGSPGWSVWGGFGLAGSGLRVPGLWVRASGFGFPAGTEGTFRPAVRASACCLVASLVSASRRRARFWPCGPQGQNADGRGCHMARTPLRPRTSGACIHRGPGLARSRGAPRGLRWTVRQQCRRFANLSQPM